MKKVIVGMMLMVGLSGCCGMYTNCNNPTNYGADASCGCGCECPSNTNCGCGTCKKVTY